MIKKISKNVYQLSFNNFGSCVYLLKLKDNILIDTSSGENRQELLNDLEKLKVNPENIKLILLTHRHWDHAGNLGLFKNAELTTKNNADELLPEIKSISTPGHTKDSLCFLFEDILFSGDTLFENGIGRTDLPESEPEKMSESLEKLKKINYKILCPGHI